MKRQPDGKGADIRSYRRGGNYRRGRYYRGSATEGLITALLIPMLMLAGYLLIMPFKGIYVLVKGEDEYSTVKGTAMIVIGIIIWIVVAVM